MLNHKKVSAAAVLALSSTFSLQTQAGSYEFDNFTVDWDSVFTAGVQYRIQDRKLHISRGKDGRDGSLDNLSTIIDNAFVINSNDGNNNFDKGFTSQRMSLLSEADFNFGEWGFFLRGKIWHDFIYGGTTDQTDEAYASNNANPKFGPNGGFNAAKGEFNPAAKEYAQSGASLLDAFVYASFSLPNDREVSMRVGRQVISWGEALLSGGGLATSINHVDAHIRSQPGLELKELFLPTGSIFFQTALTESINLEAYYQYEWNAVFLDPSSTYSSEFDSIGDGGNTFMFITGEEDRIIGINIADDQGNTLTPAEARANGDIDLSRVLELIPQNCPPNAGRDHKCRILIPYKLKEDHASSQGQAGLALNFFLENGDEFGIYAVNYHEKIPSFILPIDAAETFAPIIDLLIQVADQNHYENVFKFRPECSDRTNGCAYQGISDIGSAMSIRQLNALLSFFNAIPKNDGTIGSITADLIDNPSLFFSDDSVLNPFLDFVSNDPLVNFAVTALAQGSADLFLSQLGFSTDSPVRSLNYRLKYFENVHMLGLTYSTVIGSANVATEFTYRHNTPVLSGDVARVPQRVRMFNWHINTLMVFEPFEFLGIQWWDFSSFTAEALIWNIPGKLEFDINDGSNPDRLAVQNTPQGVGISFFWSLEYQNVFTGWDIVVPIYTNWGIDGAQFNAGYRDGQVTTATGITFRHLSGIELGLGIAKNYGDSDDIFQMLVQDRDNVTAHFKYGF